LRERYPEIAILHGCEVDILPDGRLDFPDRVLERFDIVLASLHERAGHAPDQLMKRYVGAMRHPLVTLITHPTNRMAPHKRGYDLDYDRLFQRHAAVHQTVIDACAGLELRAALEVIRPRVDRFEWYYAPLVGPDLRVTYREHEATIRAVRRGTAAAARRPPRPCAG